MYVNHIRRHYRPLCWGEFDEIRYDTINKSLFQDKPETTVLDHCHVRCDTKTNTVEFSVAGYFPMTYSSPVPIENWKPWVRVSSDPSKTATIRYTDSEAFQLDPSILSNVSTVTSYTHNNIIASMYVEPLPKS